MKRIAMRVLALLLCAVMVLGLCACNKNEQAPTEEYKPAVAVGSVILTVELPFEIHYDAEGLVVEVAGLTEGGIVIADRGDYAGKSCAAVAVELIGTCKTDGYLATAKSVLIKNTADSMVLSEHFLTDIAKEVQAALDAAESKAKVFMLEKGDLDDEGYFKLDVAKQLLLSYLDAEKFDKVSGGETVKEDAYILTVLANDVESSYSIDAVTGVITVATGSDLVEDSNNSGEVSDGDYVEDPYYQDSEDGDGENLEEDAPLDIGE